MYCLYHGVCYNPSMSTINTVTTYLSQFFSTPLLTKHLAGTILVAAAFAAIPLVAQLLRNKLEKGTRTQKDFALLRATIASLRNTLWTTAAYIFFRSLPIAEPVHHNVGKAFLVLFTACFVSLSINILKLALDMNLRRKGSSLSEHNGRIVLPIITGAIWFLALAFILDNFGVKIGTIIAGLGLAGIAVGFAAQAILGDLFSYFALLFDKPVRIGDFIILDNLKGTLEHIGLKTSRLRSLDGEQIIMPNSHLTGSRIKNYKRMKRRRICFQIGVTYSTSFEKLQRIPAMVTEVVTQQQQTTMDRVHFFQFGDSSLDFEIVYYVESPDYNEYMDIQQAINLEIVKRFEDANIEFAFPTRTLFMAGSNSGV